MEQKQTKLFKWLIAILSAVLILCTVFSIAFISHNTTDTAYAGTNYTYTYNGSSWDKTAEASYKKGDVITITTTKITVYAQACFETDSTTKEVSKGNDFTHTVQNDGATVVLTDDIAKIRDRYYIVFSAGEGGSGSLPTLSGLFKIDDKITLPDGSGLIKTGYSFAGWNAHGDTIYVGGSKKLIAHNGEYYLSDVDVPSGDTITFTAVWEEVTGYTVTYNSNGATSGSVPTDSSTYTEGSSVTLLGNTGSLTKTGYKFLGWNTDKDATTALTSYTMGNSNVTFYAVWEESVTTHTHDNVNFDSSLTSSFTGGAITNGNYYLAENITLTSAITIASGQTVNLCLNGNVLNLNKFNIQNSGTLTIYDCGTTVRYFTDTKYVNIEGNEITGKADGCYETYDGNTSETENARKVTGGVITGGWGDKPESLEGSYGGAIINYGTLTLKGGNIVGNLANNGIIANGNIFSMDGGYIIGNSTANMYYGGQYYMGYGIVANLQLEANKFTFTMNGGEISYNMANYGGAIFNESEVVLNGGTISHNSAVNFSDGDYYGSGGAIYNSDTLTINDGVIISYNSARWGGAIYNSDGTFTMNGGTISGNSATTNGGGVYINEDTFKMYGGTISDNSATTSGGGVANNNGKLSINNGGTISDNSATYGGGVYNSGGGTLTINVGVIISDNSATYGGGVYNIGTLTMNGGTISNNNAKFGGGVHNKNKGTFTMNGGTISNNTGTWGAGLNIQSTTKLLGGEITGNTVTNNDDGTNYLKKYGGAGVDYYINGTLTVGGNIVIKDNLSNGEQDNIGIETTNPASIIAVSTETLLKEGAYIGVRLANGTGTFVTGANSTDLQYFHSDDTIYYVNKEEVAGTPTTYNYSIEVEFKISKVSMTLENNLKMNYKVYKGVLDAGYSNPKITFTFNGEDTPVTSYETVGDYLVFEFSNIEGKYMGDTISAVLSATKDSQTVSATKLDYSVKQYCEKLLEDYPTNEELRTLCVDILNYGSACQIYNGYNTSSLVNAGLSDTQKGYATAERSYTNSLNTSSAESSDKSVKIAGAKMLLENAINMQIMVYASDTTNLTVEYYIGNTQIGDAVAVAGNPTVKNPEDNKNYYVVNFRGLNASQLSEVITIKVKKSSEVICSATYSMESYASAKFDIEDQAEEAKGELEDDAENLEQLIKAVMAYGDSAKAYANAKA